MKILNTGLWQTSQTAFIGNFRDVNLLDSKIMQVSCTFEVSLDHWKLLQINLWVQLWYLKSDISDNCLSLKVFLYLQVQLHTGKSTYSIHFLNYCSSYMLIVSWVNLSHEEKRCLNQRHDSGLFTSWETSGNRHTCNKALRFWVSHLARMKCSE